MRQKQDNGTAASRIWLNDKEIPAPEWEQTDCDIPQDDAVKGLKNENLTARNAVGLHPNKGWNKVFMKLPHANSGGTKRDKWQFTFVITDTEGNNAVEGLTYSPDKTFDTPKDDEDSAPTLSDENDTYWYQFSTPLRDGYYPTSAGDGGDLYAQANATRASEWKFEKRQDGTFNIVNHADDTFVSPVAEYNTALKTVAEEPESGWAFNKASTKGYYTITSGTTEMNQTRAVHSYKVFNWGEGNQYHRHRLPVFCSTKWHTSIIRHGHIHRKRRQWRNRSEPPNSKLMALSPLLKQRTESAHRQKNSRLVSIL